MGDRGPTSGTTDESSKQTVVLILVLLFVLTLVAYRAWRWVDGLADAERPCGPGGVFVATADAQATCGASNADPTLFDDLGQTGCCKCADEGMGVMGGQCDLPVTTEACRRLLQSDNAAVVDGVCGCESGWANGPQGGVCNMKVFKCEDKGMVKCKNDHFKCCCSDPASTWVPPAVKRPDDDAEPEAEANGGVGEEADEGYCECKCINAELDGTVLPRDADGELLARGSRVAMQGADSTCTMACMRDMAYGRTLEEASADASVKKLSTYEPAIGCEGGSDACTKHLQWSDGRLYCVCGACTGEAAGQAGGVKVAGQACCSLDADAGTCDAGRAVCRESACEPDGSTADSHCAVCGSSGECAECCDGWLRSTASGQCTIKDMSNQNADYARAMEAIRLSQLDVDNFNSERAETKKKIQAFDDQIKALTAKMATAAGAQKSELQKEQDALKLLQAQLQEQVSAIDLAVDQLRGDQEAYTDISNTNGAGQETLSAKTQCNRYAELYAECVANNADDASACLDAGVYTCVDKCECAGDWTDPATRGKGCAVVEVPVRSTQIGYVSRCIRTPYFKATDEVCDSGYDTSASGLECVPTEDATKTNPCPCDERARGKEGDAADGSGCGDCATDSSADSCAATQQRTGKCGCPEGRILDIDALARGQYKCIVELECLTSARLFLTDSGEQFCRCNKYKAFTNPDSGLDVDGWSAGDLQKWKKNSLGWPAGCTSCQPGLVSKHGGCYKDLCGRSTYSCQGGLLCEGLGKAECASAASQGCTVSEGSCGGHGSCKRTTMSYGDIKDFPVMACHNPVAFEDGGGVQKYEHGCDVAKTGHAYDGSAPMYTQMGPAYPTGDDSVPCSVSTGSDWCGVDSEGKPVSAEQCALHACKMMGGGLERKEYLGNQAWQENSDVGTAPAPCTCQGNMALFNPDHFVDGFDPANKTQVLDFFLKEKPEDVTPVLSRQYDPKIVVSAMTQSDKYAKRHTVVDSSGGASTVVEYAPVFEIDGTSSAFVNIPDVVTKNYRCCVPKGSVATPGHTTTDLSATVEELAAAIKTTRGDLDAAGRGGIGGYMEGEGDSWYAAVDGQVGLQHKWVRTRAASVVIDKTKGIRGDSYPFTEGLYLTASDVTNQVEIDVMDGASPGYNQSKPEVAIDTNRTLAQKPTGSGYSYDRTYGGHILYGKVSEMLLEVRADLEAKRDEIKTLEDITKGRTKRSLTAAEQSELTDKKAEAETLKRRAIEAQRKKEELYSNVVPQRFYTMERLRGHHLYCPEGTCNHIEWQDRCKSGTSCMKYARKGELLPKNFNPKELRVFQMKGAQRPKERQKQCTHGYRMRLGKDDFRKVASDAYCDLRIPGDRAKVGDFDSTVNGQTGNAKFTRDYTYCYRPMPANNFKKIAV